MADTSLGPLADKRLDKKELKMVVKIWNTLGDAFAEDTEGGREEFKKIAVEQMDNMVYNATKLKELLEKTDGPN